MRDMGGRRQEPTAAADLPVPREDGGSVASNDGEESDGEFEFPFVSREPAADELFAGGRIRAFYPVFGRVLDDTAAAAPAPRAPLGRLFQLEQARTSSVASTSSSTSCSSSASSTADAGAGLGGASPDSYCLWTPGSSSPGSSPSRPPPKSGSTGSIARWRRIGELVGGRSHSDGRQKFLFLSAPPSPARDREHSAPGSKSKPPAKGSKALAAAAATELDTVAAGRRMSYGGAKQASPGGRRTFLPYRQDLVGLFANVHGLSRSPHPF
ncbi:hypothetical protein BAE44_0022407 [Dichanthelium oligosanthes]|uniref:DUF1645 domain-containing protein n=1 Tax=Dichanthelium oligosanthes TaxID=888268 RepID=A0A1E5UUT8_9POAL|nr:hypothetical protein BAE44_0022407 [Dichanthelium oligosanthes]